MQSIASYAASLNNQLEKDGLRKIYNSSNTFSVGSEKFHI
jgi:hypothetical protein